MKSVLKCVSLCDSHILFSLSSLPFPLPTLHSQAGGYQLPCQEQTTVINFAVQLKRQTLSFLMVFLTLLAGAPVLLAAKQRMVPARSAAHGVSPKCHLPSAGQGLCVCGSLMAALVCFKALVRQDLVHSVAGNCHSDSECVLQVSSGMTFMGNWLRLWIFHIALGGHSGQAAPVCQAPCREQTTELCHRFDVRISVPGSASHLGCPQPQQLEMLLG